MSATHCPNCGERLPKHTDERMPEPVRSLAPVAGSAFLTLYTDGMTGQMQLAIGDERTGYRIAGPKFNGSGAILIRHLITERDAEEIRSYLDAAFPPNTKAEGPRDNEPSQPN